MGSRLPNWKIAFAYPTTSLSQAWQGWTTALGSGAQRDTQTQTMNNNYRCEAYLRHLMVWLYEECGTTLLVIVEAPSVLPIDAAVALWKSNAAGTTCANV